MLLLGITIFFLVLYATLIGYYLYYWKRQPDFQSTPTEPTVFISVVVAARNEEHTLPKLLQSLQQQDYPSHLFEVIMVNDQSTDQTTSAIQPFLSHRFILLQIEASTISSKKQAIATGIEKAVGDLIVITDADCVVLPTWLSTIASCQAHTGASFIAAPVKYAYRKNVVEVFQALDFMVLQGITAASVSSRFHSMANGANLAYTKVAFANVNGFEGIDRVASGDDMLLMYKIWKQGSEGVVYLKSKTAIVSTQPMATWGAFFQQRRRWASKTFYYDDKRVLAVAAFVYLFNVWCVVLLVAGLINDSHIWLLWVFLLIKFIIEFPFVFSVSRFYDEKALMLYFPFFQPLHILYTVSVGLWSQWGSYEWKGRKTM